MSSLDVCATVGCNHRRDEHRWQGGHYTMCNGAGVCFTPWCTCPCHHWKPPCDRFTEPSTWAERDEWNAALEHAATWFEQHGHPSDPAAVVAGIRNFRRKASRG